jgi:hypothetical protein
VVKIYLDELEAKRKKKCRNIVSDHRDQRTQKTPARLQMQHNIKKKKAKVTWMLLFTCTAYTLFYFTSREDNWLKNYSHKHTHTQTRTHILKESMRMRDDYDDDDDEDVVKE